MGGISTAKIWNIRLVLYVDTGFNIVARAKPISRLEVLVEVAVVSIAFNAENKVPYPLTC